MYCLKPFLFTDTSFLLAREASIIKDSHVPYLLPFLSSPVRNQSISSVLSCSVGGSVSEQLLTSALTSVH